MEAKIFNHRAWITETESENLHPKFINVLQDSGFTVIKYIEHYFDPYGYTALYLLAESHFAIHTFPEEGKTYIELSSCSKLIFDKFMAKIANAMTTIREEQDRPLSANIECKSEQRASDQQEGGALQPPTLALPFCQHKAVKHYLGTLTH